jgi:hypothetical protein
VLVADGSQITTYDLTVGVTTHVAILNIRRWRCVGGKKAPRATSRMGVSRESQSRYTVHRKEAVRSRSIVASKRRGSDESKYALEGVFFLPRIAMSSLWLYQEARTEYQRSGRNILHIHMEIPRSVRTLLRIDQHTLAARGRWSQWLTSVFKGTITNGAIRSRDSPMELSRNVHKTTIRRALLAL